MKTSCTSSAIQTLETLILPEESVQLIRSRLNDKKLTARESSTKADALIRAIFAQKQAA